MFKFKSLHFFSKKFSSQFPSLTITSNSLIPNSPYSRRQSEYLNPDKSVSLNLSKELNAKKIGLVAHFYMDPEIQGIISTLPKNQVLIADSLAMGQGAIDQAKNGIKNIIVLGVDFMSENVRAILDKNGFQNVNVFRLADKKIGCSLAESAEKISYKLYLEEAKKKNKENLHVIYINTSLKIKGKSFEIIPTVTCTSSNVVKIILQAASQKPEMDIWFGPDTYMGSNLKNLFQVISKMEEEQIKKIHPAHNQSSIEKLLKKFHYYNDGICIVHDFFDKHVVNSIKKKYLESYVTAHLEVPGEMFSLAMEKQQKGKGIVGSTSDILNFITSKTKEYLPFDKKLQVVLGTESGMITMIVKNVQEILKNNNSKNSVEIVFPVSDDAMTESEGNMIPGAPQGEGCSVNGGCASCPYMKMNSLESLMDVCQWIETDNKKLDRYRIGESMTGEIADKGVIPILHMQYFQKNGMLPEELVKIRE